MADLGFAPAETAPRRELVIASLLTPPRDRSLPGDLACGAEWQETAAMLDDVARGIRKRFAYRDRFNSALALFIAREVQGAAAEIRANLALEELDRCQNLP
jgi:hypothetical protein